MRVLFSILTIGVIGTGIVWYALPTGGPQKVVAPALNPQIIAQTTPIIPPEEKPVDPNADIENQMPLANPPSSIKAVYLTSWSAGTEKRINYLLNLASTTEINAVVIDIKDYSGYVAYDIQNEEVQKYKAKEKRIRKINTLIKRLHDAGIYVIARVTIFQDPILAKARPDLAIQSSSTQTVWKDKKGLAWMDPAGKETWDYNIAVAQDAAARGFDEINFDYIRFPSDGALEDMQFPFWDMKTKKHDTIRAFFKYLREALPTIKISADIFGIATMKKDDLGIGQILEDAYTYFDYVAPMVYPSHYAPGTLGYKIPAEYPYEIIKYSLDEAAKRIKNYELGIMNNASSTESISSSTLNSSFIIPNSKLRPWLQDFSLSTKYNSDMVRKEIKAVYDAGGESWMLWNPSNIYTREALREKNVGEK